MMKWNVLKDPKDWEEAKDKSYTKVVAIFKHSTRCPTSFMAKRTLESNWDLSEASVEPYFLDLIQNRSLSHQIAQETGVVHESPQLIVLENGRPVHHASHHYISVDSLKSILD